MNRRTSCAIALALLAIGVLAEGIAAIIHGRRPQPISQMARQEAPSTLAQPPSDAELDAQVAKMIADIKEDGRRSEEAIERRLEEKLGPELWELGRIRLIAFIGIASRGPDGKPQMTETWKGRVPSDFASYIEPPGPGPWLIGRFRKGSGPLERSLSRQTPLRFCYEIAPEGEVIGV